MEFEYSTKTKMYMEQVQEFMTKHVYPSEPVFEQQLAAQPTRFQVPPIMEELKARARERGLWNLFLPESEYGAGLTNMEYAPLCEIMGRSPIAPEAFNCSAPDTGNMETIERYGNDAQRNEWLMPLLEGKIRSAFAMTELNSASSDAKNVNTRATLVGTAFAGVIYLIVCSAVVLMTPADMLKTSNAPFADFVGLYGGGDARLVLAGFAAISGFGALNGWMLLQGEVPYAMAKGGVFPAFLAKTSRRGAPVRAHILSSLFLTVLVTMNYAKSMVELFTFMALLATAISLFAYLFCAMAALRLQSQGRMEPSRAVTVVAIIATIYSFWTLYGAGEASLWSLALLAVGLPIHWLIKRLAVVPATE